MVSYFYRCLIDLKLDSFKRAFSALCLAFEKEFIHPSDVQSPRAGKGSGGVKMYDVGMGFKLNNRHHWSHTY